MAAADVSDSESSDNDDRDCLLNNANDDELLPPLDLREAPAGRAPQTASRKSNYRISNWNNPRGLRWPCASHLSHCKPIYLVVMVQSAALFILLPVLLLNSNFVASNRNETKLQTTTSVKTVASECAGFPWQSLRLPSTFHPVHYLLNIRPDLVSFTFSGSVRIRLSSHGSSDLLVLHTHRLNLTAPNVYSGNGTAIAVRNVQQCPFLQQVAFRLSEYVPNGAEVLLNLQFNGSIEDNMDGLYRSTYRRRNGSTQYAAVTQFEPTAARNMFPCMDEPAMKAIFKVSITRQRNYHSLANMDLVTSSPSDVNGEWIVDHFNESLKMSTYLIAIAVMDFANITALSSRGTRVAVHVPSEQIAAADFALQTALKALDYFESFFGIPFPLPKQDLVGLADFSAGAMENWGLITFRDSLLLYDRRRSMLDVKERCATVIVHELAHQWFGNLVTMKWWNDLWLNEGFADFMENFITDKIYPDWEWMDNFFLGVNAPALYLDGLTSSHPISVEVQDPAEIGSIFDAITYQKTSSLIKMFMTLYDEGSFKSGLTHYLNHYKHDNAEGNDLWRTLQLHARSRTGITINLVDFATAWTTQVGYPMIHLSLSDDGTKLVAANQTRFVYLSTGRQANPASRWSIPLHFKSSCHPNSSLMWIKKSDEHNEVALDGKCDWVFGNAGGNAFIRVLYDKQNYRALTEQLIKDPTVLPAIDRTVLLYDVFSFLKAGYVDVSTAMNLVNYLSLGNDMSYTPWSIALNQLFQIRRTVYDVPSVLPKINLYIHDLVSMAYGRLGWTISNEYGPRTHLQKLILESACQLDVADCISKAAEKFRLWKNDPLSLEPDLVDVVLPTAVKNGSADDWKSVLDRYRTSRLPSERMSCLLALAHTNDHHLFIRYLEMALDPEQIKPNQLPLVVHAAAKRPEKTFMVWRFIRQHWNRIFELIGQNWLLGKLLQHAIEDMSTQFDYDEAVSFFADKDLGNSKSKVEQSLEGLRVNIQWRVLNGKRLEDWLDQHLKLNHPVM